MPATPSPSAAAGRPGHLGHRYHRRPIHRGGERRDHRADAGVRQRPGPERGARHRRRRPARCRRPMRRASPPTRRHDEVRMVISSGTVKEFVGRAADRPEPRARAADRGASARRHRSDDRIADAGSRQRRHVRAAGLPAHAVRSSTAACATICGLPSSASTGQGGQGLPGHRRGLRGLFLADRRPYPRPRRHQVSRRNCATSRCGWRRSPARGVLVPYRVSVPTPIGLGRPAGDAIRLGRRSRPGPAPRPSDGSAIAGGAPSPCDARHDAVLRRCGLTAALTDRCERRRLLSALYPILWCAAVTAARCGRERIPTGSSQQFGRDSFQNSFHSLSTGLPHLTGLVPVAMWYKLVTDSVGARCRGRNVEHAMSPTAIS